LDNFRIRQHEKKALSHYATDCWDLEYNFPFGYKELQGIADRGTFDLTQHQNNSKTKMTILDEETKEKFIPEVVCEPSLGVERTLLVFLYEAYSINEKGNTILKLHPKLAPVKAAIFPLIKGGKQEEKAKEIFKSLKKKFNVKFDNSGSVGRRYARNDEIGTPFCITVDEETLENETVTIRNRNNSQQIRVKIENLKNILEELIEREKTFEDLKNL
jgi:glycyl-tRNA synthetase